MAGLVLAGVTANVTRICLWVENYCCCFALGPFERAERMGKFFVIMIAVSVAILLAMSAYVISL